MDPLQRQALSQQLMGGASPILQPRMVPRQLAGLPPTVANQIAPYQGMAPPHGQPDFMTAMPPPFPSVASTPQMDPMTAIKPSQGPSIDPRGETRIPGIVPDFNNIRRNI